MCPTSPNPKDKNLQWTLVQPGGNNIRQNRGNLPYARQNQKPKWLSKTEWLSFANMRSWPNNQVRNVLVAIQERQLPFNDSRIHMLINHTLFHLGTVIVQGSDATLEWKRDLCGNGSGQNAYEILSSFYDEIKDTPKNYQCVKLLGSLCNFFSAWEPSCRELARQLSKSVHGWGEVVGASVKESPPSSVPNIRSKQVVLYQQAINVLAGGSLNESDVELLMEMLIKSRNLYTRENRQDEIKNNWIEVQNKISEK